VDAEVLERHRLKVRDVQSAERRGRRREGAPVADAVEVGLDVHGGEEDTV